MEYQICTGCITDTTDPEIQFDDNRVCNHCGKYEELAANHGFTGKKVVLL